MIINKKENAARNIFFGVVLKIYQIMGPFFVRTVLIYVLGMEYLGLSSLFASILQMLNMAELGVGSAMVYSMYRPIAEDDTETICKLMNLYKRYYRLIGTVVLVLGFVLLPFISNFVKGDVPNDINLYVLYILNLLTTSFSYWLYAYKNSILLGLQRNDIIHKMQLYTTTIQYVGQILILVLTRNYYLYCVVALVSQILNNVFTAIYVSKYFPEYDAKGQLASSEVKTINKRIADLFTSKIGGTIVTSADSIVISSFLGLAILGIYNNYFYICSSISGFVMIIFYSFTAGIGNSIVTEKPEKVYADFHKLTLLTIWVTGFCTCCLAALYQPFMEVWIGKKNMLDIWMVVGMCVYFYINLINLLLNSYKDAAGIWKKDKYRTLTVALVNLVMNITLVQYIGLYGVLFSTVFSELVIGVPWIIHNLFTEVFTDGMWKYIKRLLYYTGVVLVVCYINYCLCELVSGGMVGLMIRSIVCVIFPNICFWIFFGRLEEFKYIIEIIKKYVRQIVNR